MKVEDAKLVLSNHWHKPGITAVLFFDPHKAPQGGIRLEMALTDFTAAVLAEIKHPTRMTTRGQLGRALRSAISAVVEKVKASSTEAVA